MNKFGNWLLQVAMSLGCVLVMACPISCVIALIESARLLAIGAAISLSGAVLVTLVSKTVADREPAKPVIQMRLVPREPKRRRDDDVD